MVNYLEPLQNQQIILVTGPTRSGKSEWAETLAKKSKKPVIYVATALENTQDQEWLERITRHQERRPPHWETLWVPHNLSVILETVTPPHCLLIDSIGTWVANCLEQDGLTWIETMAQFLDRLETTPIDVILVAEEAGWGIVPAFPLGRTFRDRLGNLTRHLGAIANLVYLVTGGHALNLSLLGEPLTKE
ncbi:adenosylcobinamide kinase/adenosylcobinamide-phosphate guanylyltransferase [cyanobacterium endosymbiont of Rhopalodia gibberula]|uniref:bifunctional adenosylcobinamide kinase/adenosylcobinamide-phosphate guanylyltransferase n=1 Tax=cyanobacterium endosymbiont of Rhopalodia gibberula TaxID=1763363 RepID=UPI000DC70860|nr:bifunctional adenosylcobinamide kinase/adenosylcobinamide-phosphate guanylyltransferase [cyanobacterium endosymbiont of Rhopalodia gibberula]BBA79511.1 adenosylcobinamide kinase/adenosylcobinamide-phosphate guanylyltransferase [cyanobacterium endosymbiont of Rhopalodia gibberula]